MSLLTTKAFTDLFTDPLEKTLIQSAYARFNDLNDPLRCNLFSLIAREMLRIFLVRIAPDKDVQSTEWFDPSINSGKATRADRFRYALTGRITDEVVDEHPALDVSTQIRDLISLADDLSKYAHITSGTIGLDIVTSTKYLSEAETILIAFCETYFAVRAFVRDKIYEITQDEINDHLQDEMPEELDALSSHTVFDHAVVEGVEDIDITSTSMSITGHGYVEIELNYGSKDDGVSSDDNYPFEFEAEIDPQTLRVEEVKILSIDTRSFYE